MVKGTKYLYDFAVPTLRLNEKGEDNTNSYDFDALQILFTLELKDVQNCMQNVSPSWENISATNNSMNCDITTELFRKVEAKGDTTTDIYEFDEDEVAKLKSENVKLMTSKKILCAKTNSKATICR